MKKQTVMKKVLPAAAFLAIALALLFLLQALLMPKYMTDIREGAMIAEYYGSVPRHSVVFFGDCEIYNAVNPAVLWDEYGIPSWVRGSAQQLIFQTYYLMEETLDTEKPDIVVFNAVEMLIGKVQKETYTRMTLDGMRFSRTKIEAVKTSLTEGESFASYFLPILRYHSRWNDLTKEDFEYWFCRDKVTYGGYLMTAGVQAMDDAHRKDPQAIAKPIPDNCWEWLDKIRELCAEKGTTLILLKSPTDTVNYPWYDTYEEQVSAYAEKYGIRYINAIREAEIIGTDSAVDYCDGGDHLSYIGAERLSRYLGKIFREEYGLPDLHGDRELAAEWDETVQNYKAARTAAESGIQ